MPQERKKSVFFNMRRFHNHIKRKMIEKYSKNRASVLDLASGKGGDLLKYIDNGFSYIEGYDLDKESVLEATRRKNTFLSKMSQPKPVVNLYKANLITEYVKSANTKYFDLIVCNFAFHYFFKQPQNILKTIANNSMPGTVLLLTLLEESLIKETDTKNLKITRMDEESICVYIKDSVLDEPREEYIVSKENLEKLLYSVGFILVEWNNFYNFYEDWENSPSGTPLKSAEKKYSFMNNSYVFIKK
jgi:SAM-dependent methyltransferase